MTGSSLTNITIPASVTSVGDSAFIYCTGLEGVYFRGPAPSIGASVFTYANNVTVYYLPGTIGWGTTLGGRPTALWGPKLVTSDVSFGVQSNRFGFNITWAKGQTVVVQACTNFANPIWFPLQTNVLTADALYFGDASWTEYPTRGYRVRSP